MNEGLEKGGILHNKKPWTTKATWGKNVKQTITVQIQGQIEWRTFRGQSGVWIAVCDSLNLTVEGETWGEMQEAANEAIELLMTDLASSGEFDAFLRKQGWVVSKAVPVKTKKRLRFDIPTFFEPPHATDRPSRPTA